MRGAQAGSASAIEALFRLHWPAAFRAAYLVCHDAAAAEDIAQEAFLAAVRGLDRFDRRRPFGPWLHRIAVNRAIDWARRAALRARAGARRGARARSAAPELSDDTLAALADARAGAARGDRAAPPARLHARRDRRAARPAARHRELAAAPRPRHAAGADAVVSARAAPSADPRRRTRGRGARLARRRGRVPGARARPERRRWPRDRRRGGRGASRRSSPVAVSPAGSAIVHRCATRGRRRARARRRSAAARARPAARHLRGRPVDRAGGRLEAAARPLRGGVVVAARAVRRRHAPRTSCSRWTRRARCAGRWRRPAGGAAALGARRLPDRLPRRERAAGRERRRHGRPRLRPCGSGRGSVAPERGARARPRVRHRARPAGADRRGRRPPRAPRASGRARGSSSGRRTARGSARALRAADLGLRPPRRRPCARSRSPAGR